MVPSNSAGVYEAPALDQRLRTWGSKVRPVPEELLIEGRVTHDLTINTSRGCVHRGAGILSRDGGQGAGRTPNPSGG